MKNKLIMPVVTAGVLALTGLCANANTISLSGVSSTTVGHVGTGVFWDYTLSFNNVRLVPLQGAPLSGSPGGYSGPSFINVNDFGLVLTTGALPLGWTWLTNPGGTWSLTQPLVGQNSALTVLDSAAVEDAFLGYTGGANTTPVDGNYVLRLDTALTLVGGTANYSALDIVNTGATAGNISAATTTSLSPRGVPTQGPDGGVTAMLLGAALSALGLIRRKLA